MPEPATDGARPVRRRRILLRSVRARTTAVAVVVLALALGACGISLLVIVRGSLIQQVDEAAEVLAEDAATRVERGSLAAILPVPGGKTDDDHLIQVVDADGRVIAATENFVGQPPILPHRLRPGDRRVRTTIYAPPIDRNDSFRVMAMPVASPDGPVTVLAATELEEVQQTVETVRRALLFGAPTLLVGAGIFIWLLVGRALRPVESIRRQVAEISSLALDRRVPEPPVNDEVGRLAHTMNAMLDRLQSSTERQRRFVADASHELRSPLTSSRAQLEVAAAHPDSADWEATAAGLLAENERMEQLVADLLFLARSDEAAVELSSHGVVDLDDVVLAEVTRVRARGANVDVSRVSAGRVLGHADHLARVVRNLLENAVRHARSIVTVELHGEPPAGGPGERPGTVTLCVCDDGPGIPPEERDRVFDRFVRLDDARSRDRGGAGLGLAITREIVHRHGGEIFVEDGPAGGARLVVRLPAG